MRGTRVSLSLLGILLVALGPRLCNGLCNLENGTMARCHDLEDAKYIDTYELEILKTSVSRKRLHPAIFRNLTSLRHLDLSDGELEHIEPGTFRQLHELRSLDLSHNKISSLELNSFEGLKKLRSLNIRRNALKQIPAAALKIKNLKVLDLVGNPLDCNCMTLKVRDHLLDRGVHLSKRVLCLTPSNLRSKPLLEPDVQVICMFEEQDKEMQMDDPGVEGSGEVPAGDPFDDLTPDEFDDDDEPVEGNQDSVSPATVEIETPAPTKSSVTEESIVSDVESGTGSSLATAVPENSLEKSTGSDDGIFFSEESDRNIPSPTVSGASTKSSLENGVTEDTDHKPHLTQTEKSKELVYPVEGSGEEEDLLEGSGIEGSGTGVPPISWDIPYEPESSSSEPVKPTDGGLLDMLFGVFWSTSATPEEDTKKDLDLEEEEFINVSTEKPPATSAPTPVEEKVNFKTVVKGSEGSLDRNHDDGKADVGAVEVGPVLGDSKSGKVKAEDEASIEASDASPARQSKKGMGSYVVLAALLAVLGALIGFAAYKGDFCRKKRKRTDVEGGTELKDMRKSLLDSGNGNQPKIASNGNMENVPLVSSPPENDTKVRQNDREPDAIPDASKMKYSAVPDVIDPVKPPRKSFVSHDEPDKALNNGRSHQDLVNSSSSVPPEITEPVCLRTKTPAESAINGKRHRDSASSLGTDSRESPSARTSRPDSSSPINGSLGTFQGLTRPPLSPGAQRVKITLQDNPDSVPKTPILITRTKAGENLVKTP